MVYGYISRIQLKVYLQHSAAVAGNFSCPISIFWFIKSILICIGGNLISISYIYCCVCCACSCFIFRCCGSRIGPVVVHVIILNGIRNFNRLPNRVHAVVRDAFISKDASCVLCFAALRFICIFGILTDISEEQIILCQSIIYVDNIIITIGLRFLSPAKEFVSSAGLCSRDCDLLIDLEVIILPDYACITIRVVVEPPDMCRSSILSAGILCPQLNGVLSRFDGCSVIFIFNIANLCVVEVYSEAVAW